MSAFVSWIAFGLALACGVSLFLSRNWRWILGCLAGQYLALFLLVQITLPLSSAAAKLVTGWMASTILAIAQMNTGQVEKSETNWPQGQWFRVLTSGIVLLVTLALAQRSLDLLGISLPAAWTGFFLIGIGLLQLGVTGQPFRVVLGLLTTLSGFEIVYAGVENSALVTAFLVVINLGLAMAGSYFLAPLEEGA
jgi:hypothetical protein